MYAAIETGGTKTVCAVGRDGHIQARTRFPTGSDPDVLVAQCAQFFAQFEVEAAAVGTFGPHDSDPASATFGHVLATPKPGWSGVDVRGLLQAALGAPVAITSDVTAAAIGEARRGAGSSVRDLVYLTIGTGIGGGVIIGGNAVDGPEVGHMLLPQSGASGVCPYHAGCFEGLASGPAMQARSGRPAQDLPDDHPAWDAQAEVVAAGLHNIACVLSPELIIVGGGVGSRQALHDRLPGLLADSLAGYIPAPRLALPGLGSDSGVIGALFLAQSQG